MAATKEALVIIVDVGKRCDLQSDSESETFLEKEKTCCMKILQKKLFNEKKDEVGFVLMGTNDTQNELNADMGDGYEHIIEAHPVSIPNWSMIRAIQACVTFEGAVSDWLDALIVAMTMLKKEKDAKKFGNLKIVLFSTFASYVNDDNVTAVINGLNGLNIELIVISDNVEFPAIVDETEEEIQSPTQGVFTQRADNSQHQQHSERLIQRIVNEANGCLCNFDYAISHLMNYQRKRARPFFWYSSLDIGSQFKIQICSTILIKHENPFKWKTESAHQNMITQKVIEHFKDGEKIDPTPDDLIKGYMLGSTPIAFDESLGVTLEPTEKGLKCLHFCNVNDVPSKYWAGSNTNLVLPKKDMETSNKMFHGLVAAMKELNMAMIARRVYNNGTRPKLVVLIPTLRSGYPCLLMYDLLYGDQFTYWYFPLLRSKKSEPTQEQTDAIGDLIDSMDLMDGVDGEDGPKEAFPHRHLLNISVQYIYETVTKRALNPKEQVATLDGRLHEVLKQPQKIRERSDEPLKNVKNVFKLESKAKTDKKFLVRRLAAISGQPDPSTTTDDQPAEVEDVVDARQIVEVGTVSPAEDFIILHESGEHFSKIALQIQNVINDLIFKSMTNQDLKIARAIAIYREQAIIYNPVMYNEWIRSLKEKIVERKKFEFWENIIVKENFGLISTSESELELRVTETESKEFYSVSSAAQGSGQTDAPAESVDDLFDIM